MLVERRVLALESLNLLAAKGNRVFESPNLLIAIDERRFVVSNLLLAAGELALETLDMRGAIAAHSYEKSNARAVTRLRCHSKRSCEKIARGQKWQQARLVLRHLFNHIYKFNVAGDPSDVLGACEQRADAVLGACNCHSATLALTLTI